MTLPRATFESARSMTRGSAFATGTAKAIGLVPKSGLLPPQGAMAAGAFANIMAIRPCSAKRSTVSAITPA
ncbi:hypothetical protein D1872_339960 [compost metagenome]